MSKHSGDLLYRIGEEMSDVSQDCWNATWMEGTEWYVPALCARAVQSGEPQPWGQYDVSPERARSLVALADALGSWAAFGDETADSALYVSFNPWPTPKAVLEAMDRRARSEALSLPERAGTRKRTPISAIEAREMALRVSRETDERLDLERAEPPAGWTREPPTEPGWYWMRELPKPGSPHHVQSAPVEVIVRVHGGSAGCACGACADQISDANAAMVEWQGPIKPSGGE